MKKLTFICLLFFTFSNNAFSQGMLDDGTTWYYSWSPDQWFQATKLKVIGDAVINGQPCKEIEGQCVCGSSSQYMYEENGKVYRYLPPTETFELLYDFTLEEGDTLTIASGQSEEYVINLLIDSIRMVEVGGEMIETQFFSHISFPYTDFGDKIYKNIGSNGCLVPTNGLCAPPTNGIRCYDNPVTDTHYSFDAEYGWYMFEAGFPCDTILYIVETFELNINDNLLVAPNPTSNNQFHLTTDHFPSNAEIHIYSPLGQLLSKEKWIENGQAYTLPGSGVYYIAVITEGKQIAVRKVVGLK